VPALSDITDALDRVNRFRDTPSGTLRLNVPMAVGELIVAPLIARFLATYPQLKVELVAEDALVDIVERGFDAGVRYGESLARDMIAVSLVAQQRFVIAASPDYVAARGRPTHPTDLLQHSCIRHRFTSGVILPWEFEKDGESVHITPDGPLATSSSRLALRAAEGGVGFIHTFEDYARPGLEAGRLVSVLEDWCPPFPGPFLYYPSRRHMAAGLRAFIDFVRSEGKSAQSAAAQPAAG
jgi:DNA-binding transcriptional LysR family regulator